jgi:hypothetical protein
MSLFNRLFLRPPKAKWSLNDVFIFSGINVRGHQAEKAKPRRDLFGHPQPWALIARCLISGDDGLRRSARNCRWYRGKTLFPQRKSAPIKIANDSQRPEPVHFADPKPGMGHNNLQCLLFGGVSRLINAQNHRPTPENLHSKQAEVRRD